MANRTDDLHGLSHTKWNCKYLVVFAPKYRRKAFYDARRLEIGSILRQLCEYKGVNIIEEYRSCTYAIEHTTKNECIKLHGIFERKE